MYNTVKHFKTLKEIFPKGVVRLSSIKSLPPLTATKKVMTGKHDFICSLACFTFFFLTREPNKTNDTHRPKESKEKGGK